MRLLFFILLTTGALVQIYSLKLVEDNPDPIENSRTKRELDVEDVINRFEMERESPLHDIFHLPPFEQDWNNALSTNYTVPHPSSEKPNNGSAEFKVELSKDEEHVVSQSGGRYRGNSAVNWWYSVESYSNVTHFNITDSESEFGNGVENKQGAVRKPDEDHVVSRVPGLSIGRETTLDEVVIESPTTPRMSVTLPPKFEQPNITTRYILLQSGRIVAINVTSVSSVFKATSGSSSNKPALPPVYFGSRIRKTNNSFSHNANDINKRPSTSFPLVKPAVINVPTRSNTPSLPPVRLQKFRADFVTTKSPPLVHSIILTTPSSIRTHASTERLQIRADITTTKSPRTVPSPSNTAAITPPPTARIRVLTETPKLVEGRHSSTKTPSTTLSPKKLPVLLDLPEVSTKSTTEVTKITKATTKRIFEISPSTKPVLADRLLYSPVPTTVRAGEIQHLPTKQPLALSTENAPATLILKATKAKLDSSSEDRTTTPIPAASLYTLPPRNIIETIFEVFHPDTSEIPFLVVTFDSLKEQSPTSATSIGISPTEISSRAGKERRLTGSKVEYEKVRSTKPTLIHYNFNPYQRTGATTIQDLATTKVLTTTRSRIRGLQNNLVTLPTSSSTEQEFTESTDSITKLKHDFVRIGALISFTTPITVPSSSVIKPEVTSSRRPRYRGLQFVTTIPRTVSPPTFPPVTVRPTPVTSSRKPRHQQGFHLRNSVGFQTIPPGSFTDRRSYSSSNNLPAEPRASPEAPIGRMSMDEVLAFRFEPTRKNSARLESLQQPPTSGTRVTEPYTVNWFRGTTKKVRLTTTRKAQVTRIVVTSTTRSPRQAGLVAAERTRVPTAPGRVRNVGERTSQRERLRNVVEVEQNGSSNTTTAKPFRVYYFEPKRKRPIKDEIEIESPRDQRNRISVEHVKSTTKKPPIRTWVIQPQRAPRILNTASGRSQPITPLAAPPITTTPSNIQDRSRRGRARYVSSPTASPLVVTVASTSSHPPSKKPWYSPFIRHQPNVGTTTVLPPDRRVVTITSSSVRPTRAPPVETFPLPPGDSFEEIFFQPVKIQRIN